MSESAVAEQTAALLAITAANGATSVRVAKTAEDAALIWKLRKECLWSTMSQHHGKLQY